MGITSLNVAPLLDRPAEDQRWRPAKGAPEVPQEKLERARGAVGDQCAEPQSSKSRVCAADLTTSSG
ncbi:unnamed protein product [Cladocopium goreaui]|uniref:Uncharacterized protein n=1 Tax=Cladocopium goreaui TaxID=2562237 RepID=A0A9P1DPT7_9DINO|nr:unnamed protein product [Cladocopium goreaui]